MRTASKRDSAAREAILLRPACSNDTSPRARGAALEPSPLADPPTSAQTGPPRGGADHGSSESAARQRVRCSIAPPIRRGHLVASRRTGGNPPHQRPHLRHPRPQVAIRALQVGLGFPARRASQRLHTGPNALVFGNDRHGTRRSLGHPYTRQPPTLPVGAPGGRRPAHLPPRPPGRPHPQGPRPKPPAPTTRRARRQRSRRCMPSHPRPPMAAESPPTSPASPPTPRRPWARRPWPPSQSAPVRAARTPHPRPPAPPANGGTHRCGHGRVASVPVQ